MYHMKLSLSKGGSLLRRDAGLAGCVGTKLRPKASTSV